MRAISIHCNYMWDHRRFMRAMFDARVTVIAACTQFPMRRNCTCARHRFTRAVSDTLVTAIAARAVSEA